MINRDSRMNIYIYRNNSSVAVHNLTRYEMKKNNSSVHINSC